MTLKKPQEDDTALLIAALNHVWTMYDTRTNRAYQLLNYYLVASAIVATAYASAINGKHYGLAAVFSVAGIGLSALAFAAGLREMRAVDEAEPALITLQGQIASKLDIDSIRIVKAGYQRRTMTIGLPAAALIALLGIGTLLYALIHSGFLSRVESVTRRITPMQADARIQADIAGETRSSR